MFQNEVVYVHFPVEMLERVPPPELPKPDADQRDISLFIVQTEEYIRKIQNRDKLILDYLKRRKEQLLKPKS